MPISLKASPRLALLAIAAAAAGVAVATTDEARTQAPTPPPAAFGSARDVGPRNAPRGPSFTNVVRTRVPSGEYAVSAKAIVTSRRSTGSDCYLFEGDRILDASNGIGVRLTGSGRYTHTLLYTGVLGEGGPVGEVRVACRAGISWTALSSKVQAIAVDAR